MYSVCLLNQRCSVLVTRWWCLDVQHISNTRITWASLVRGWYVYHDFKDNFTISTSRLLPVRYRMIPFFLNKPCLIQVRSFLEPIMSRCFLLFKQKRFIDLTFIGICYFPFTLSFFSSDTSQLNVPGICIFLHLNMCIKMCWRLFQTCLELFKTLQTYVITLFRDLSRVDYASPRHSPSFRIFELFKITTFPNLTNTLQKWFETWCTSFQACSNILRLC